MRQLERETPTPEQEGILGKCWNFILAWHKQYDKNGIMYKTCQGKPPDGNCKLCHAHPELYSETHLRNMMMSLDEGRAKKEDNSWNKKGKGKGKDKQGNGDEGETPMDNKKGHNAEGDQWWTVKCNFCGKYGHSTRGCEANPHWNVRCDNCNNVGHIRANCIASQATIARGMQQKADWIAKGGGDGKGKKGKKGKKRRKR